MSNIFIDLDGTILDSKQRVYKLFIDLSGENLTFENYWNYKRDLFSNEWILEEMFYFTKDQIDLFSTKWLQKIESNEYLAYDKLFNSSIKALRNMIDNGAKLHLVTSRQFASKVSEQLNKLKIHNYLKTILVTEAKISKLDLIKKSNIIINEKVDLFIGDTGVDINTGKALKIKTIAVLSGFRSLDVIKNYNPDFIFKDILEFSNSYY